MIVLPLIVNSELSPPTEALLSVPLESTVRSSENDWGTFRC